MFFSLIMLAVAVYLAKPVFTGKGKLLEADHIKEGKEKAFKRYARLIYAGLFIAVLLMASVNYVTNVGYTAVYHYTFTEDYTDADGILHPKGEENTADEMSAINMVQDESSSSSSGSMCATTSSETASNPYEYTGTTYTLSKEWLSFISYSTAKILNYVILGITMALVIGLFIFINMMTDKEAKKKDEAAVVTAQRRMPDGAFNFDDYEEEIPSEHPEDKQ